MGPNQARPSFAPAGPIALRTRCIQWSRKIVGAVRAPRPFARLLWKLESARHRHRIRRSGVVLGTGSTVNPWATFMDPGLVRIGCDCSISGVVFATHSGYDRIASKILGLPIDTRRPIVVGDRCFIGAASVIMGGTRVGNDCVVGAGSVVRGDIPNGSVVLGNPARVVGSTAEFLERLKLRAERAAAVAQPAPGGLESGLGLLLEQMPLR